MLQLLVSVSLNALEQSRKSLLLLLAQQGLLLFNVFLQDVLGCLGLFLFHLLALQLE